MANYNCVIRTNYFHVKDETAFQNMMETVRGRKDRIKLFEAKDESGSTVFGFGVYGGITGICNTSDEDTDDAYDRFVESLKACIADDDAIIILEVGHEKMKYVVGTATIITSEGYEDIDLTFLALTKAADMLKNPEWETKCEY